MLKIPLKTKDLMTLANILSGFMSILYVIEGNMFWASYAILIGFLFDMFDGIVARMLKQTNKFGAEFDNIADLITYSVAPSFVVYGFFIGKLPFWLTLILSALPISMGAIRFARYNVKRIEFPGAWIGFPRPASALLIVGIINSHIAMFSPHGFPHLGYYIAAFIVAAASFANLGMLPYMGHHNRKFEKHIFVFLLFLAATTLTGVAIDIALRFDPFLPLVDRITWDVITIWLINYGFVHQYYIFSAEERKEIKKFINNWLAEEANELSGKG